MKKVIQGILVFFILRSVAHASEIDFVLYHTAKGQCEKALSYAEKITDQAYRYSAFVKIGICFHKKRAYAQAVSAYIEAYHTNSENDLAPGLMALAYYKAGELETARTWIENALNLKGPNYHRWLLIAGMIYPRLGLYKKLKILISEAEKSPAKEVKERAHLMKLTVRKSRHRWISYLIQGKTGVQFDSNPGLYSEISRDIVRAPVNDIAGTFSARGKVEFSVFDFIRPGLFYRFYQNIHSKADEFDFQLHRMGMFVKGKFGKTLLDVRGGYQFALYTRDLKRYLEGGFVDVLADVRVNGWGYFLGGGYRKTAYYEEIPIAAVDRDSSFYYLLAGFSFYLMENVLRLDIGSRLLANSAEQEEWTYLGDEVFVTLIMSLFARRLEVLLRAMGTGRFFMSESLFLTFKDKRYDLEYGGDFRLRWRVKPYLFIDALFTYRRADSNVNLFYDYTRYLAGMEVGFEYF